MALKYKNGTRNIMLCCLMTMIGSLLGQCNSLGSDIVGGEGIKLLPQVTQCEGLQ